MPMYPWIKDIFLRIRRGFNKRQNIFVISVTIIICGIGIVSIAILLAFKLIDIGIFISSLVTIVVVIFISIYSFWNAFASRKIQTLLISFLSKYLLTLGTDKLDDLLGLLMQSKLDKLKVEPVDEFFKVIKELCIKGDYNLKRRITEALPAFYDISFEDSINLIKEILRYDWDEKYKSDNRRRTIESFNCLATSQFFFIEDFLNFYEGDQIFTVIAIIENLGYWKYKCKKKATTILYEKLLIQLSKNNFSQDELECVKFLWKNLEYLYLDIDKAREVFFSQKDDENIYKQICIARNLKYLCQNHPEEMLALMNCFLDNQRHRYVRRPIAKEDSIEWILKLYNHKNHKEKTQEILWKLICDEELIIRETTFDRIETILYRDKNFGGKIIKQIINKDLDNDLGRRAKRLLEKIQNTEK